MLNHARVIKELTQAADKLFVDYSVEYQQAYQIWQEIAQDAALIYKVRHAKSSLLVPEWQGLIGKTVPIEPCVSQHRILAIDGSQIYPDKHQGIGCFLVNIGIVELAYGQASGKKVSFDSTPYLFMGNQDGELSATTDTVNSKRQELEFNMGLERSIEIKKKGDPFIFLFDGSLIFWHLDSKDQAIKNTYLPRYIDALESLYKNNILMAGYISLPKSKELINIVRLKQANFVMTEQQTSFCEHIVDASLMHSSVPSGSRTIVFKNQSTISESYPEHLKPYFFYIHGAEEVARVEIPAWIAQDESCVEAVASMILDQARKGHGYPVGLAEAHEQAVVKGPDRDFFYHLVQKVGMEHHQRINLSQKIIKKRGLGV